MSHHLPPSHVVCPICGHERASTTMIQGVMVRPPIAQLIAREHSGWSTEQTLCYECLNRYRAEYVEDVLEDEKGQLSRLERDVVESVKEQELLSKDVDAAFDRRLTLGERVADRVASFGGSWAFLGIFGAVLVVWMAVNVVGILRRPFDPYPFILLNLVLSCLAAVQAPVIMMSQNRQETKDRLRGENDYQINLKAELEVRHLNEKLDLLLTRQWSQLLEIQRIQLELMQEVAGRRPPEA